jgi:hypothetical protein
MAAEVNQIRAATIGTTIVTMWSPDIDVARIPDTDITSLRLNTLRAYVTVNADSPDEARVLIAQLRAACDEWERIIGDDGVVETEARELIERLQAGLP